MKPFFVCNITHREAPLPRLSSLEPTSNWQSGHAKQRELEGREQAVVSMVMLTVGVHNGSGGPVMYTANSIANSVRMWDGRPIVVYHPNMFGHAWAGSPDVFNRQRIGTVFNSKFDGQRLIAEAWIDVQRANAVDQRVMESIADEKWMEVSTGVVVIPAANEMGSSHIVASQLYPDHLALLPDQIGACSLSDGCGLLRNSNQQETPLGLPTHVW